MERVKVRQILLILFCLTSILNLKVNYANLSPVSFNTVDMGATYRPEIVRRYLAVRHTTGGGRWE